MSREEMIKYYCMLFLQVYGTSVENEDFSKVTDNKLSDRINEVIGYNMSK